MTIFKTIQDWLLKNFANVFSLLGLILTIYFGIFYVPNWIKESQNEKVKNAQEEILQTVKELVYSDSTFTIKEIGSLVRAKELSIREKFPLSISDILTKAEESFMEDKYLPFLERRELIKEIEDIKNQIPKEPIINEQVQKSRFTIGWLEILSILASVIIVILGLVSVIVKYQTEKDKEEEILNEKQIIPITKDHRQFAYEFERQIEEILAERFAPIRTNMADSGLDFLFIHNDIKYFIEIKYLTRSKVGLNSFSQLKNYIQDKKGEAWLIYNTDLTPLVAKEIEKFNNENNDIKIKAIRISTAEDLKEKLDELIEK